MLTVRRAASMIDRGRPAERPPSRRASAVGRGQPGEHLLLAPAEQLREHPVDDHGSQVDVGLGAHPGVSSRVSLTGISAGVATTTRPVVAGSSRMLEHPPGLLADQARPAPAG